MMKTQSLFCIALTSLSLLSGCQSIDNLLTDSGMRQHSQEDIVVNPVPRRPVPEERTHTPRASTEQAQDRAGSSSLAPVPSNAPAPKADANTSPNPGNTPGMVPNVAPSLGE